MEVLSPMNDDSLFKCIRCKRMSLLRCIFQSVDYMVLSELVAVLGSYILI